MRLNYVTIISLSFFVLLFLSGQSYAQQTLPENAVIYSNTVPSQGNGDAAASPTINGPSSSPTPIPGPETRSLKIHITNNYRSEFMGGEKYYIDGYVTEKTASGIDLDSVNSKVDVTIRMGGSVVYQGSNNDLAPGFRFSYSIPDNNQQADYTVELSASKSPVDTITYTNSAESTAFRTVKRPQIDSVELRENRSQHQDNTLYRRSNTTYMIIWFGHDSINEPFRPENYSVILNITPAIPPNDIRFLGWIYRTTDSGFTQQMGVVYSISIPVDENIGKYQLDAKASYYLGEGYNVISPTKSSHLSVIFDSGSKFSQYVYDPPSWHDSTATYYVFDEMPQ